jgi:hypothetical protein
MQFRFYLDRNRPISEIDPPFSGNVHWTKVGRSVEVTNVSFTVL